MYSLSEGSDDDEDADPSQEWQDIHARIKETIAELDGKVTPKLNWSSPKDATWISATNDMQCSTPNDIYLLLKSSDFVTHDLEHAFDDCVSDNEKTTDGQSLQNGDNSLENKIPYHLVLRKYVNLNPSLEFRCFVRDRKLLCICQRDLNHFEFLFALRDDLRKRIQSFFDVALKDSFPDPNFVFDVYIPPPHNRVWLIDFNPWAVRTDPLLFSWMEILGMRDPDTSEDAPEEKEEGEGEAGSASDESEDEEDDDDDDDIDALPFVPEFRLVEHDDPEAYNFTTPRYSAHKMPREVVDASKGGAAGMGEFLGQWQDILARKVQEDNEAEDDEN